MAWGVPKTNWEASDEPGASDVNRWEGNQKYNYDTNKVITATGTGTNITLTTDSNITLVDGLKLMFRAAANNNGGSTTVTVDGTAAKPLYKSGTTDAPNIKAGKAYTIWYHAGDGCFYAQDMDSYEAPLNNHINDTGNPHETNKEQIGLSNVENKSAATIRQETGPLKGEVVSSFPTHADGKIIIHTGNERGYISVNGKWV